ncbi:hypothetical protein KKC88_05815 [Patescibacteria group bacterium]|nr:hypothetical protein [Patescibacteria group bacterium]MBU1673638.1 hypothetical protein [Patescibacteria group bacterium]MBU1963874.1 hypothetical protein [Patescibacteria group bacterium]
MKKYTWPILVLFGIISLPFCADAITCQIPEKQRKAKTALVTWTADEEAVFYNLKLMTKNGKKIKTFKHISALKKQIPKKYLITNKDYALKARGIDEEGGKLPWSDIKKFRTKPAKVRELIADNYTAMSVDLKWKYARGKSLTYKINIYDSQGNCRYKLETLSNYITLPILTRDNDYQAKVQAKYNKKNLGRWSDKLYFSY